MLVAPLAAFFASDAYLFAAFPARERVMYTTHPTIASHITHAGEGTRANANIHATYKYMHARWSPACTCTNAPTRVRTHTCTHHVHAYDT